LDEADKALEQIDVALKDNYVAQLCIVPMIFISCVEIKEIR
jgi:hypothetical protein